MRSSPRTMHLPQRSDRLREVERAFDALADALEGADRAAPETTVPVIERLTALNRTLRGSAIPPEEHAAVRAAIDQSMLAVSALLSGLVQARDEVGLAIERLRCWRPGAGASGRPGADAQSEPTAHRLDLHL